jgi:hypothetical protein
MFAVAFTYVANSDRSNTAVLLTGDEQVGAEDYSAHEVRRLVVNYRSEMATSRRMLSAALSNKSFICCGLRPSGPAADPFGND